MMVVREKEGWMRPRITPFPKLTSLLLEDMDFNTAMDQHGALYKVIAYVLRWRWENNTSLNMLGIDDCVITSDHAKCLEKYVQELRWDGDEGHPNWWKSDWWNNPGTWVYSPEDWNRYTKFK